MDTSHTPASDQQSNPFTVSTPHESDRALVVRATLQFREELLALDPWIPFPQNACCYSFGRDKRPLPVGAILLLWDTWPSFTGVCPECGDKAYGFGFGGLLSTGGVIAVCIGCGAGLFRWIGGLSTVGCEVSPFLAPTAYALGGGIFGGCVRGERRPLIEALKQLGATDLPGDDWVSGDDPSAASLEIQLPSSGPRSSTRKGGIHWAHRLMTWIRRRG